MKKRYLFILALLASVTACRKANQTEVRPLNTNTDTTQVLLAEDRYPCMELKTEGAVYLNIPEKPAYKDTIIPGLSIHYIPLETTEESIIGRIEKLESDDSYIFIFDKTNNQTFRFSQKDGSFLNKFGHIGRGPGEYIELRDMTLDKKRKEVCLLDYWGFKILYFNYDGEYLREQPLYYLYDKMEFVGDRMVLHTHNHGNERVPAVNNNRLVLAKQDQTPLFVGFPYSAEFGERFRWEHQYPITTCNGEVYYNYVLSDTIWQIKENGRCEAKFIYKFPGRDNLFNNEDFQKITEEDYLKKIEDVAHSQGETTLTKDFLYARVSSGTMLYCRTSGNYLYGEIYFKLFAHRDYNRPLFTLNDTSFVYVVQPFDILRKHQKTKDSYNERAYQYYWENQLTEEERQLLNNMTEEDNPILLIMDIEPF